MMLNSMSFERSLITPEPGRPGLLLDLQLDLQTSGRASRPGDVGELVGVEGVREQVDKGEAGLRVSFETEAHEPCLEPGSSDASFGIRKTPWWLVAGALDPLLHLPDREQGGLPVKPTK